jgi:predicted anti-sigma-YlaC factor YlaD
MTCREFAEFLDAFLAGTLSGEEGASFRRHLAVCTDCQSYLDTYRRTVDLCESMRRDAELPRDVPEDLVKAILQSRRAP